MRCTGEQRNSKDMRCLGTLSKGTAEQRNCTELQRLTRLAKDALRDEMKRIELEVCE